MISLELAVFVHLLRFFKGMDQGVRSQGVKRDHSKKGLRSKTSDIEVS